MKPEAPNVVCKYFLPTPPPARLENFTALQRCVLGCLVYPSAVCERLRSSGD